MHQKQWISWKLHSAPLKGWVVRHAEHRAAPIGSKTIVYTWELDLIGSTAEAFPLFPKTPSQEVWLWACGYNLHSESYVQTLYPQAQSHTQGAKLQVNHWYFEPKIVKMQPKKNPGCIPASGIFMGFQLFFVLYFSLYHYLCLILILLCFYYWH